MSGKNRIRIYGPKSDGSYWVEFRTTDGERGETAVLKHFERLMPYGIVVPDDPSH